MISSAILASMTTGILDRRPHLRIEVIATPSMRLVVRGIDITESYERGVLAVIDVGAVFARFGR